MRHPHSDLPASAFWRSAVAEADPAAPAGIFAPKFGLGRDVAIATAGAHADVDYFSAYEIVTDPAARGCFFHHDLREVTAKGVAAVMGSFLGACGLAAETGPSGSETPEPGPPMPPRMSSVRKSRK